MNQLIQRLGTNQWTTLGRELKVVDDMNDSGLLTKGFGYYE